MQRNVEQGREKGLHAGLSESLSRKGLSPVAPLLAFIIKENSAAKKKKKNKKQSKEKSITKINATARAWTWTWGQENGAIATGVAGVFSHFSLQLSAHHFAATDKVFLLTAWRHRLSVAPLMRNA